VTPLLLQSVSKHRGVGRRSVLVLREVSLALAPGEIVLLEGPSGSGKTTLLGVAGGVLSPDAGQVFVSDLLLTGQPPARQRELRVRHVGFVFQRANLLSVLTARENIVLMGILAGMTEPDAGRGADQLLAALGMTALADRRPTELSGGEEQRVAVARALVHRPAVVLADEPTGGLDAVTGHAVAEALARLAHERGSAVLIGTHDARLASFASRRLAMTGGRVEPWHE
jgi:putative ABC transport system ATP-binding protein